MANNRLC